MVGEYDASSTIAANSALRYTEYKCLPGYKCLGGAIHPSKRDGVSVDLCQIGSFCDPSIGDETTS